jgi:hypothetical protein
MKLSYTIDNKYMLLRSLTSTTEIKEKRMKKGKNIGLFVCVFCLLFIAPQFCYGGGIENMKNIRFTVMSYNITGPFGLSICLEDIFSSKNKQKILNRKNFAVNYKNNEGEISSYRKGKIHSHNFTNNEQDLNESFSKTTSDNQSKGIAMEFRFDF